MAQLLHWNPYLKVNSAGVCTGWEHPVSYCVEAYLESVSTTTTTVSSTRSSSTTTSTTSKPSATSWTNMGCYIDAEDRTLINRVDTEGGPYEITIEKCQKACWAQNYMYAGLEVGQEFYCDNSIRNELARNAEQTCTDLCYGDNSQLCGGGWRLQVFRGNAPSPTTTTKSTTSTTTAVSAPIGSVKWTLKGCYQDVVPPTLKRTLYKATQISAGSATMTIEACQSVCWRDGFPFAGVEFGKECYCGASIRSPLATDAAITCNVPCAGNKNQLCGGGDRIHIFEGRIGASSDKDDTWNHLGCYKDLIKPRALDNLAAVAGGSSNVTIGGCTSAAKTRSVKYAGVENGNECWIGNTIKGESFALSDCSKSCSGNKTEICGGLSRMNIYENTILTPKWLPMGCYTTTSAAQTLTFASVAAAEDN